MDSQVPGLTDLNPGPEESVLFYQWEQSDLLVNGADYLLEKNSNTQMIKLIKEGKQPWLLFKIYTMS